MARKRLRDSDLNIGEDGLPRKFRPKLILSRSWFVLRKVFLASPFLVLLVCLFNVVTALEPILTLWIERRLLDSTVTSLAVSAGPDSRIGAVASVLEGARPGSGKPDQAPPSTSAGKPLAPAGAESRKPSAGAAPRTSAQSVMRLPAEGGAVVRGSTDPFRNVLVFLGLACGIALASIGLQQYSGYVSQRLSQEVTFQMRQEIYDHCTRLDYAFFETPASQDILVRCQNMSIRSITGMFYTIVRLANMALTIVASLLVLLKFSPVLCAVAFAAGLPNLILNARLSRERYRVYFGRSERSRMSGYYGYLLTMPWYAKEAITLGLSKYFFTEWKEREWLTMKEDLALNAKQNRINAFMGWLNRVTSAGAQLAIIVLTARQRGTIGMITMNLGLFNRAQGYVQGLSDALSGLNNDAMFLEDYFKLMAVEPSIEPPRVRGNGAALNGAVRSIEFRNVSFAYPNSDKTILHNVSFGLEAGESLFMAGRNGAGKTSIIKLMLRLYDPTEGVILINGRDAREFPASKLRKCFSVLMQDYVKYPFTVRENIVLGDIDNRGDETQLREAVEASKLHEIMPKLPEGLETHLMKHFSHGGRVRGVDLSGGEWQKLGLARSFFRHSSVFILDEPTSNLDVESEAQILAFFREYVKNKIAIIVSHRLSAAAVADRVLFVDEGRIVEDGKHSDLIQGDGPYAALFRLQQEGFSFL